MFGGAQPSHRDNLHFTEDFEQVTRHKSVTKGSQEVTFKDAGKKMKARRLKTSGPSCAGRPVCPMSKVSKRQVPTDYGHTAEETGHLFDQKGNTHSSRDGNLADGDRGTIFSGDAPNVLGTVLVRHRATSPTSLR